MRDFPCLSYDISQLIVSETTRSYSPRDVNQYPSGVRNVNRVVKIRSGKHRPNFEVYSEDYPESYRSARVLSIFFN